MQRVKLTAFTLLYFIGYISSTATNFCDIATSNQLIKDLCDCRDKLSPQQTEWENVTIVAGHVWDSYVSYDEQHISEIKHLLETNRHGVSNKWATEQANALPQEETNEIQAFLQQALSSCKAVQMGGYRPIAKKFSNQFSVGEASSKYHGYFIRNDDGKPQIWQSYNGGGKPVPGNETMLDMGLQAGGLYYGLKMLSSPTTIRENELTEMVKNGKQWVDDGLTLSLLLDHSHIPDWAKAKYPGLWWGKGPDQHFVDYDIDNPVARVLWDKLFQLTVPALTHFSTFISWDLINEPGFSYANSTYTYDKWRSWLVLKYDHRIDNLNSAWRTHYTHFSQIPDTQPGPPQNEPYDDIGKTIQFIDFTFFNRKRTTEFMEFLCNTIKKYAHHTVHCTVKTSNHAELLGKDQTNGIDRIALMKHVQDYNGCDTRIIQSTYDWDLDYPQYMDGVYGMDWTGLAASWDFMHSVVPNNPLIDMEWHSVQTLGWNGNYTQGEMPTAQNFTAALWLGLLHHLSGVEIWYYSRNGIDPTYARLNSWTGSMMTYPAVHYSFITQIMFANSISTSIAMASNAPNQVVILWSPLASLLSTQTLHVQAAVYEAVQYLGVNSGWITAHDLVSVGNDVDNVYDAMRILFVPCQQYMESSTYKWLKNTAIYNATTWRIILACDQTDRVNTFMYDESINKRSSNELKWLNKVEYINIGEKINSTLIHHMNTQIYFPSSKSTPVPTLDLHCVIPAGGPVSPQFGVHCRYSSEDGIMFIINLLIQPTTITLKSIDGHTIQNATNVWDKSTVTLGEKGTKLLPAQVLILNTKQ